MNVFDLSYQLIKEEIPKPCKKHPPKYVSFFETLIWSFDLQKGFMGAPTQTTKHIAGLIEDLIHARENERAVTV